MAKRLSHNLSSRYIEAANRLNSKKTKTKIVAFIEGYDDIGFWSNLLEEFEDDEFCFEVMLPSRTSLGKGKKVALANELGPQLGKYMIACVDADYDYLMAGATETSRIINSNPYIFHTYVYAIENYQCYAPSLQQVCVMATLNDRRAFDFVGFLTDFSQIVWPLFVWSVWCYRHGFHKVFSMLDFYHTICFNDFNFYHPEETLLAMRNRVNRKINRLQHQFPQAKKDYKPLQGELRAMGVTPETTYLYMRGHDLMDGIVLPIVEGVCENLKREREREIRQLAEHSVQMQNELSSYQHSTYPAALMLRKQTGYRDSAPFKKIEEDICNFLDSLTETEHII